MTQQPKQPSPLRLAFTVFATVIATVIAHTVVTRLGKSFSKP